MKTYIELEADILRKRYECIEDMIDEITVSYRAKEITLEQRNYLMRLI